jgi:hypothetical protein
MFNELFLLKFVLVFFDDILVYSKKKKKKDHIGYLSIILKMLAQYKLYAKMSKYRFFYQEVEYLGHIVLVEQIKADLKNIKAMIIWS